MGLKGIPLVGTGKIIGQGHGKAMRYPNHGEEMVRSKENAVETGVPWGLLGFSRLRFPIMMVQNEIQTWGKLGGFKTSGAPYVALKMRIRTYRGLYRVPLLVETHISRFLQKGCQGYKG